MVTAFNWILLLITVVIMIALAVYSNKVIQMKSGEGGFLLAAGGLGPFIGAATIVATGFSGWGFMGSPGMAYKYGAIELLGNFFFAPAMVLAVLLCARFLREKAQKMGSLTIPEYIVNIHDGPASIKRLTQTVAALVSIVLLLVFLVGQIKALGLLAGQWLEIEPQTASLILIAIIMLYTSIGGLAAVAFTDAIMVMGMCISALVIVGKIFLDIPLFELLDQVHAMDKTLLEPTDSGPYGSTVWHVAFILPYAFIYATTLPFMAVRFMALSKKTKLHHVIAYMTPMACLLSLVPLVGIYTRLKVPGLENPDQAMPVFLNTFMSPMAAAIITLFILFAMKSTANSVLHAISSAVSHDLRQSLFSKTDLSETWLLRINRSAVWLLGMVGFLGMLYAPPVMLSMLAILGSGTLMAALIAPVLLSHFIKGNIYAALISMLTGFGAATILFLFFELGWMEAPLYASAIACASYALVVWMTSLLAKNSKEGLESLGTR
ncbi:sodium:solute symporter family protein [Aestuariirhabdus sp. Z084]|uniref:sodium:solute symporter family protein n=1 Tax=Aestuariirhabdus haliotis TaxID=2918751 RepID=UPI00201B391E|nr:sodium:solute symporter family protein [Aestuariirhabdus haliotis]MCL6415486.1 sodium:solute symporter family protein [Aestuariirhabdus haliotis]MCL6419309.1 sodium:solute symporter family protein [Aestuariirhabdus haliotis]